MKKRSIYVSLTITLSALVIAACSPKSKTVSSEESTTSEPKTGGKKTSSLKFTLDKNKPPYEDLKKDWDSVNFDKYFLMGAQQAWKTWTHAGEIWQGADYSKYGYALSTETYTWIAYPDKKIEKMYSKDLPKDIREKVEIPILFYKDTLKGKDIAGTIEKDNYFDQPYQDTQYEALPKSTVHFAISSHEMFHGFQGSWETSGQKYKNIMDSDYQESLEKSNEDKEARKIRANLMESLRKAIVFPEKEKEYLETAKYWNTKYQTEHSEDAEFVKGSDIHEGSARYFDDAMSVRSVLGMDASKDEIFKAYQKMVTLDFKEEKDIRGPDKAYELGGFAGMLLEKHNDNLDWQERVQKGERLIDILLEDYEAKLSTE
ncbi:hypothetical protein IGL98_002596 [Enterococcus sp. DIV0840]|uniref:hypothetical protein n=1 Tax=unclassified Enterococcus TaxID=2608891 RepID=UPI001A900C40|nr:hypothetical protein [Enterococcus sp. DIV0849a]MBO0436162.1 hypothetical protein [Enterococcus sp. DIV0849a]